MDLNSRRSFLKQAASARRRFLRQQPLPPGARRRVRSLRQRRIAHLTPTLPRRTKTTGPSSSAHTPSTPTSSTSTTAASPHHPSSCSRPSSATTSSSNEGPSYYMWGILDQGREPLRRKARRTRRLFRPEEIAIDRNSTEALNTIIYGLTSRPATR